MKVAYLILIPVAAILLSGCSTVKPQADVSGIWDWKCCSGENFGKLELQQASDGQLVGRMFATSGGANGRIKGKISGNFVEFTRTWRRRFKQHYTLALSSDGRQLTGSFDGTHVESATTEFEAVRK